MKKNIMIALGLVAVLSVSGFIVSKTIGADDRYAGESEEPIEYKEKDTTENLGSVDNPYTILEVVPDKSMATIGYLIPGCEPVSLDLICNQLQLSDEGLSAAAKVYSDYYKDTVSTIGEVGTTVRTFDVPDTMPYDVEPTEQGEEPTYGEIGYYQYVGDTNGNYQWDSGQQKFVRESGAYQWVCAGKYELSSQMENVWYLTGNQYTDLEALDGQLYYSFTNTYTENSATFDLNPCAGFTLDYILQSHNTDTSAAGAGNEKVGDQHWMTRVEQQWYGYQTCDITNNDVLIQSLFDGAKTAEGFCSQVITVTPQQLNYDGSVIDSADMIIIHDMETGLNIFNATYGGTQVVKTDFSTTNCNDLSWDTVIKLVEKEAGGNPAAMILDDSAISPNNSDVEERLNPSDAGMSNLSKLYAIMNTYGAKYFYNVYLSGEAPSRIGRSDYASLFEDIKTQSDVTDVIGASNFVYDFSGDEACFASELLNTGAISKARSNAIYFTSTTENTTSVMSMVKSVQGEVTGRESVAYKTKLKILELEPCNEFIYGSTNWKEYYLALIPWFIGTDKDIEKDVEVDCKTLYQLSGDMDDLNTTYDLIIVGGKQDATNGAEGYNDSVLGNLAFTAIGDRVSTAVKNVKIDDTYMWKLTGSDTKTPIFSSTQGTDAYQGNVRGEAIDLTKKKYYEILDFAKAKSVVIDASLYNGNQVNTDFVDESSFVYALAKLAIEPNEDYHVFENGDSKLQNGQALKEQVGTDKCSITYLKDDTDTEIRPQEYSSEACGTKNVTVRWNGKNHDVEVLDPNSSATFANTNHQTNENGNVLEYQFTLQGEIDVQYGVKLYIDKNGNGIYEGSIKNENEITAFGEIPENTSENIEDVIITDITDGQQATIVSDGILYAGHSYKVQKELKTKDLGIFPWKLELYNLSNSSIRYNEIGYTNVKTGSYYKQTIKILQMCLTEDMSNATNLNLNLMDNNSEFGAKFDAYLESTNEYEASVTYLTNGDWTKLAKYQGGGWNKVAWCNYLDQFDIFILGFADNASVNDDQLFREGLEYYVNQGKSLIISHDVASDRKVEAEEWNDNRKANNAYLRVVSGQLRRYFSIFDNDYSYSAASSQGGHNNINMIPNDDMQIGYRFDSSGNATSYLDKNQYTEWWITQGANLLMDNNNSALIRYGTCVQNGQQYIMDRKLSTQYTASSIKWPDSMMTNQIRIENEGQITQYPYGFENDTIEVASTHTQYNQLDLNYFEDGDACVWYNLTDNIVDENGNKAGIYSSREGDSANNFYLYTKGNVTYTGMGHSSNVTNDEVKLFVNTVISAYRKSTSSKATEPYLTVTGEDATVNGSNATIYIEDRGDANQPYKVTVKVNDDNEENLRRRYSVKIFKDYNQISEQAVNKGDTVSVNGTYNDVIWGNNNGEINYTFELTSQDIYGNKTSDKIKVKVAIMPLFNLY